jgi:hypothetical protein
MLLLRLFLVVCLVLGTFTLTVLFHNLVLAQSASLLSKPDVATRARIAKSYSRTPLSFEANRGQADSRVKFVSHASGYSLFWTADEAVLSMRVAAAPKGALRSWRDAVSLKRYPDTNLMGHDVLLERYADTNLLMLAGSKGGGDGASPVSTTESLLQSAFYQGGGGDV